MPMRSLPKQLANDSLYLPSSPDILELHSSWRTIIQFSSWERFHLPLCLFAHLPPILKILSFSAAKNCGLHSSAEEINHGAVDKK